MELIHEEFMGSDDLSQKVKGKRTKRHRSSSPYEAVMTTSHSSCGGGGKEREEVVFEEFDSEFPSTTTSSDHICNENTEEEDMANCLILLAQGDDAPRQVETTIFLKTSASMKMEKFTPPKFSDLATSTPTTNKAGFYVYKCKTCSRSFPSFQALGGHRASHKRPKPTNIEEKKLLPNLPLVETSINDITLIDSSLNKSSSPSSDLITLQTAANNTNPQKGHSRGNNIRVNNKVHECSICGSEFNSGQALGGHMRRHRANTGNSNRVAIEGPTTSEILAMNGQEQEMIEPRKFLPLDLNLPATEDDHYHQHHHSEPKFGLASTQQGLALSAPALVDCHY